MARIPSALALLEAPVRAVVMDTDGTVQVLVGLVVAFMASVVVVQSAWIWRSKLDQNFPGPSIFHNCLSYIGFFHCHPVSATFPAGGIKT
ncbi:hypothetical protein RIE95_03450 [Acidithiobacillus thiooxidans]|uniref:hypothetical protein n=1 Tax=Acidithiobacillus thiooxidans TaxID=930 RepID=UPI00285DAA98|nr:hypothetical protein [Acidithiobacillus thiooxidans]MDR7926057.1 hypothetical protein [Acidithiobacillus thiooxidans]